MADAIVQVKDGGEVQSRVTQMETRFATQRRMQRDLDAWRHMDLAAAEADIWRGIPENARRRTIMKPDIASVTTAMKAMLSGKRPKIRTRAKNALALKQIDQVSFNERVGAALFDTLDRIGPTSLLSDSAESIVHRGELIFRALWLSPEERGEERETVEPAYLDNVTDITSILGSEPPTPEEVITKPGRFPLQVDVLDPVECSYSLGSDGRVVEFAHHYWTTWSLVLDNFPGIRDKDAFKGAITLTSLDQPVEVIDYWTEDEHAILVNNRAYKEPQPHHYPRIPFIVEQANPRPVRLPQSTTVTQLMGTPFCLSMLEPTKHLSWADSMLATYLEEGIFSTITLEGIDPDKSPYYVKPDGGGPPEFRFEVDASPGARVVPLHYNERLGYAAQPPIVASMQDFRASRSRDSALVGLPDPMLSGAQMMDLSGYAYSQMKQLPLAKLEPHRMGMDRGWSRLMMLCNDLIVAWWDLGDVPLVLTQLMQVKDEQQPQDVELDKGAFLAVADIEVTITPEVPINEDAEKALVFQAFGSKLMSKLTAIEELGYVQDASAEMKRMAFEDMEEIDPNIKRAVALQYAKENNIPVGGAAQQGAPGQGPPQPQPAPSLPSSLPGGGPAPAGPPPPGGIDPAMIQQARQQFPQATQGLTDEQIAQMIQQASAQAGPPMMAQGA